MAMLELTPEQTQVLRESVEPISIIVPNSDQKYVIILADTLHELQNQVDLAAKKLSAEEDETVEYRYLDIRDDVADEL